MKFLLLLLTATLSIAASTAEKQVLVLADSVYQQPVQDLGHLLKSHVRISYGKYPAYHSGLAIKNLDKLLQGKKWDLIYFNYGLNDLMYKDPTIKEIRAMHKDAGGVRVTSPQQYKKNLEELVRQMKKATRAKLVWASTTPIVGSSGILDEGSEVEYNQIAAAVMKKNNVPVVDMHAHGLKVHKAMRHAKTYNYKNSKVRLETPMMLRILEELNLSDLARELQSENSKAKN